MNTSGKGSESAISAAFDFVASGLDESFWSWTPDYIATVIQTHELVTWESPRAAIGLRSKDKDSADYESLRSRSEALAHAMPRGEPGGLRLIARLERSSWPGIFNRQLPYILQHRGYEALATDTGVGTALASLVLDSSPVVEARQAPTLSWPLQLVGEPAVFQFLRESDALVRGLASFVAPREAELQPGVPRFHARIVELSGLALSGPALALRLFDAEIPRSIPDRLGLRQLEKLERTIVLRPGDLHLHERFTLFVSALSRNLPLDAAAWAACGTHVGSGSAPLVLMPRGLLLSARITDTIPALRQRLYRLAGRRPLRFSSDHIGPMEAWLGKPAEGMTAAEAADLLVTDKLRWDRSAFGGSGLVAIHEALVAAEFGATRTVGISRGPRAPAPRHEAPLLAEPVDDLLRSVPPVEAKLAPANGTAPPPRYTDIRLLDSAQAEIGERSALLVGARYFLQVSIKTKRQGLGKDQDDQGTFEIPGQNETAHLWIVVTDESEDAATGTKLSLLPRIAPLDLPSAGDSNGFAEFSFAAAVAPGISATVAGRLGIRIYHKLNLIDHAQLDLRFLASAVPTQAASAEPTVGLRFLRRKETFIEVLAPDAKARALTISISKPDQNQGSYRFTFATQGQLATSPLSGSRRLSASELDGFVADFRDILVAGVFDRGLRKLTLSGRDSEELLKSFSLLGTRIASRIFDYAEGGDFFELWQMAKDALADQCIVQIALSDGAEDFVFPWQVLTLQDYTDTAISPSARNLWGYRYVIEIKRCGDRGMASPVNATAPRRITYSRWDFWNEAQHHAALQKMFADCGRIALPLPVVESRDDFLTALRNGGGDLFYVYAHGYCAVPNSPLAVRYRGVVKERLESLLRKLQEEDPPGDAQRLREILKQLDGITRPGCDSALTLSKSEISLTAMLSELARARLNLRDNPIVFLNTCESAQNWNSFSGSFVDFFLDRGARAVIGTESTVPIVLADAFGKAVLESIISGKSVGEAVLVARNRLLDCSNNPLGLCYCVYGAADSKLF